MLSTDQLIENEKTSEFWLLGWTYVVAWIARLLDNIA
jgi:hypothetical protein